MNGTSLRSVPLTCSAALFQPVHRVENFVQNFFGGMVFVDK
jgi:hypothetical protein